MPKYLDMHHVMAITFSLQFEMKADKSVLNSDVHS